MRRFSLFQSVHAATRIMLSTDLASVTTATWEATEKEIDRSSDGEVWHVVHFASRSETFHSLAEPSQRAISSAINASLAAAGLKKVVSDNIGWVSA